jgi:hypothetical protein
VKIGILSMLKSHKFWAIVIGMLFVFGSQIPFIKLIVKPVTPAQYNAVVLMVVAFIVSLRS